MFFWLLSSKVINQLKMYAYFSSCDYMQPGDRYCKQAIHIHISVGTVISPHPVWLMPPWLTGIFIDNRGFVNAFGCMWFESTSTYYTLQNGGGRQQREKKEVAWYNRTLQGEEALRPYSSTLDHRCAFACVLYMWSITVCLRVNTWNITYNNFFPARSWASGGQGVCSSAGQGVPLQERFTG